MDTLLIQFLELNRQATQLNHELSTLLVRIVQSLNTEKIEGESLEETRKKMLSFMASEDPSLTDREHRVLRRIKTKGELSKKNITMAFSGKIHSPELTVILTRLERLGLVRSRIVPGRGRPVTTYEAT